MSNTVERVAPETKIGPDRPLIILQTSDRFTDHAEHGREAVRVWRDTIPADIKPYVQLQIEIRNRDHEGRYRELREVLIEMQAAGVPTCLQIADPHDPYVFDPLHVEKLVQEFSCIKTINITENRFEHFSDYNVPRYATPPHVRYAIDVIHMAARYGKLVSMSFQGLKWMHIACDELNQPLVDTIYEFGEYILPQNEHLGPQHLTRQTSTWGFWIAGATEHWGVEPQSWWFENGRMLTPGLFGQDPDNTRAMPPLLYRAMILEAVKMGATVFQFEPFWDLYDYDNSVCWREAIYPTLMEAINRRLIPTREQVMEKIKVAYHLRPAKTITEFHVNTRDVDWITNEGLLAKAAYGLWERFLQHELIPNKGRHYYIPLLPPKTPQAVLDRFAEVITPGRCDSVEAYEALLAKHYEPDGEGEACIMSINGHTYVMQTHENLYERQDYAVDLPKPVRGLDVERGPRSVTLTWEADPGASRYYIHRFTGAAPIGPFDTPPVFAETAEPRFTDNEPRPGDVYTYAVTADTTTLERRSGTVNYLDYLVLSLTRSLPVEAAIVGGPGETTIRRVAEPPDTRPASQVVYPTFDGAEGEHRIIAGQIVTRIDRLKQAYDGMDWRKMAELYSTRYRDPNGFDRNYVAYAWKWWFIRNNTTCLLRQIRRWDFSEFAETGVVHLKMFSLYRGLRRDDQPYGYGWDGTTRIPRNWDEEVVYSWARDEDGVWRLIRTDPAVPCFMEILWGDRPSDKAELVLKPGFDEGL